MRHMQAMAASLSAEIAGLEHTWATRLVCRPAEGIDLRSGSLAGCQVSAGLLLTPVIVL